MGIAAGMKLLAVVALVGAVSASLHVYPPAKFAQNALCVTAGCEAHDVCVVRNGKAHCVDKKELKSKLAAHHREAEEEEKKHQHHHKHTSTVDHHEHESLGQHKCSHDELMRMGGRLVQWFSDVHNSHKDVPLVARPAGCRQDVAWMFEQWDGNNDAKLSKKELAPLEGGQREKCLAQFIDMCDDEEVDGEVSMSEWCDCFTFSAQPRDEPACHQYKHNQDPHMLGVFIPRCDLKGYYQPEQCNAGQCWCVDKWGREFDHSRVNGQLPDCGQYASKMGASEKARLEERI